MEYTVKTALGDLFVIDRATPAVREVGAKVALGFAERGVTLVRGP
jgi:hypothetical protein